MTGEITQEYRKALNFDLDTKRLEVCFEGNPRYPYKLIEKYLTRRGFEHRQWSGYTSMLALSDVDVVVFFIAMKNDLPWFLECANRIDVTNIGDEYDILSLLYANREQGD